MPLWHFGVEFILFAQLCIKGLVGFGDKNSVQTTREEMVIIGEFEILVVRFLSYGFQRPWIRNTGRVFNKTVRSYLPPKRVPKKIPHDEVIRGTAQACLRLKSESVRETGTSARAGQIRGR